MYSTCLFCHRDLGRNEVIEHFPVGRRLAFDPAKGRLWVVCAGCARWNLTPLEERWEAIEECERVYRATPLRASTEHVGLARTREGLALVRIGQPQRPEFAAWRYAMRLHARRHRALAAAAGAAVLGGVAVTAGAAATIAAVSVAGGMALYPAMAALEAIENYLRRERVVARVQTQHGMRREVRSKHLHQLEIVPARDGSGWGLTVGHDRGREEVTGPVAVQMAGQLLARLNRFGATAAQAGRAVDLVVVHGGPERFVRQAAELRWRRRRSGEIFRSERYGPFGLAPVELLALEMATQEDAERQALEGELALLEAAWREAEEIAAIADDLLLPEWVRAFARRGRAASD